MSPPKIDIGKNQITHGSRARQTGEVAFAKTEPAVSTIREKPRPLLEVRKRSRLLLAERYARLKPQSLPAELVRYPEMQMKIYIESISNQPDVLRRFYEDHEESAMKVTKQLVKMLGEGGHGERNLFTEELAMIASDLEIYGKDASVRALKALVKESLEHNTKEAKDSLASLGFDIRKVQRIEIVALTSSRIRLWLSKELRETLHTVIQQLKEGFVFEERIKAEIPQRSSDPQ